MPTPKLPPLPRVALHEEYDPPAAPMLAVSVNEAVRISGVGRTSIYEAIGDGRVEAVKCGSKTLVLIDSLRAFIASLPRIQVRGRMTLRSDASCSASV